MTGLEDAWRWYRDTKELLQLFRRLADRYWTELPWERGRIGRDDRFRQLEGPGLAGRAEFSLDHFDDLAVVVLFSVFEAAVRDRVKEDVETEARALRHAALRAAAKKAIESIDRGGFFQVLEPFKDYDGNLIEEINQVRRYRNYVAHGQRGDKPDSVTPEVAYNRLSRFLKLLEEKRAAGDAETTRPEGPAPEGA